MSRVKSEIPQTTQTRQSATSITPGVRVWKW